MRRSAAGNIGNNAALFRLFINPNDCQNTWSSGELQRRYGKPEFEIFDSRLRMNARTDFRWEDPKRMIEIADLPIIWFQWALGLMEGHDVSPDSPPSDTEAPATKVVGMYPSDELVGIGEGLQIFKGMVMSGAQR